MNTADDPLGQPLHPGMILRTKFLVPLGITETQLARDLGVTLHTVNAVVCERRGISQEMADGLARVLKTPREFWIMAQANYDRWRRAVRRSTPSRSARKPRARGTDIPISPDRNPRSDDEPAPTSED